jgi:hypothetical protein
VGLPHRGLERPRVLEVVDELAIGPAVHFLDEVPEDDLPLPNRQLLRVKARRAQQASAVPVLHPIAYPR